jgi:NTP pyrophosphatase (non-canonical NTP hydrolase)
MSIDAKVEFPLPEFRQERTNHDPYHNFVTMDGQLTDQGVALVHFAIRVLGVATNTNAVEHGWWDKQGRNFGELIALIHSEASEALEAYRDGDDFTKLKYNHKNDDGTPFITNEREMHWGDSELGKPEGVASELADIIIRVMDMANGLKIPVADAIIDKHAYNVTRPIRHGNKLA